MKEPVPAAQTLFISKSTMAPLSSEMYLESWPPVHLEVDDGAVVERDVFGVLTAYLEDGVDVFVYINRGRRVRRDLVLDDVRADEVAGEVAPRAGGPDAPHDYLIRDLRAHLGQAAPDGLDGPARGHQVPLRDDVAVLVHRDDVGRQRAHVDAEEAVYLLAFFRRRYDVGLGLEVNVAQDEALLAFLLLVRRGEVVV